MNPARLSRNGSSLTQALLRAAREERPSASAKADAIVAATGAVTTGSRWPFRKAWVFVGLGAIGLLGATAHTLQKNAATSLVVEEPPIVEVRMEPRAHVPGSFILDVDEDAPVQRTAVRAAAPTPRSEPTGPSELDLVHGARIEIVQGHATAALELLDRRRAAFPKGAFREEAAALRVEALVLAGDFAAARALAARFAAAFPESAYAERVRSVAAKAR
jgi:hypothetical protein